MSDFGTMRSRIADDFINESITTTQINNAIKSAIAHYERRPFFFNEETTTFDTVADQQYYDEDDRAAIPKMVKIFTMKVTYSGTQRTVRATSFEAIDDEQDGSVTGVPDAFAYARQSIRLYPIPNDVYTVRVNYIRKFNALADDTDTNAWMTDAEELIRQSAKRRIALDIIHAEDLGAHAMVLEREAYDELLAEGRRRRPNTTLQTPAMLSGRDFDINRGE